MHRACQGVTHVTRLVPDRRFEARSGRFPSEPQARKSSLARRILWGPGSPLRCGRNTQTGFLPARLGTARPNVVPNRQGACPCRGNRRNRFAAATAFGRQPREPLDQPATAGFALRPGFMHHSGREGGKNPVGEGFCGWIISIGTDGYLQRARPVFAGKPESSGAAGPAERKQPASPPQYSIPGVLADHFQVSQLKNECSNDV